MTEDLLLNLPPGSLGAGVPFYPSTEVSLAAARLIAQAEQIRAGIAVYPDDAVIGVPMGGGGGLPTSITDDFAADSGLWLDGDLAPAAITVSGGRGIWTPTKGSNVVVNGTFDNDTGWTYDNPPWTIGAGVATKANSSGSLSRASTLTVNTWYEIGCTSTIVANTDFRTIAPAVYVSSQTTPATGYALSTTLHIYGGGTQTGTLDNVTAEPLTLATLFRVQPIYYTSAVTVGIRIKANTWAGVVLFKDIDNFILLTFGGGNRGRLHLIKRVAGTQSVVGSVVGITYANDALLQLIPNEAFTAFSGNYNNAGINQIDEYAIADFAGMEGTWHAGMFNTYNGGDIDVDAFDNFAVARVP